MGRFLCRAAAIALCLAGGISTAAAQESLPIRLENPQASPGLPRHDVACRAANAGGTARVDCDVRFEQPIGVLRAAASSDGEAWTTNYASVDVATDDAAILFLIDRGGSGVTAAARDVEAIVDGRGPLQQISVAAFGQNYQVLAPFAAGAGGAEVGDLRADNSDPPIFANVLEGVRALAAVDARRRTLVLMSDGGAGGQGVTANEVAAAARAAGIRIISVAYGGDEAAQAPLATLAEATGGLVLRPARGGTRLPQAEREGLLRRLAEGGAFTAEAPRGELPEAVDISFSFAGGGSSSFRAVLDGSAPPAAAEGGATMALGESGAEAPLFSLGGLRQRLDRAIDVFAHSPLWLALAVILVLLVLWVLVRAFSRSGAALPAKTFVPAAGPVLAERRAPERAAEPATRPAGPREPETRPASGRPSSAGVDLLRPQPAAPVVSEAPTRPVLDEAPTALAAAEAMTPAPRLVVELANGHRVESAGPQLRIGRSSDNDLIIDEPNVSRRHAVIQPLEAGGFEIVNLTFGRDGGETNPVAVNGRSIGERGAVAPGDEIKLGNVGDTRLRFATAS